LFLLIFFDLNFAEDIEMRSTMEQGSVPMRKLRIVGVGWRNGGSETQPCRKCEELMRLVGIERDPLSTGDDDIYTFECTACGLTTAEAVSKGVHRDCTRTEAAAEAALHRLESIVESSDDAIITKDLNGVITSWNKAAERIFGYLAEEAVGKHITMLIPVSDRDDEERILGQIRRGQRVDHYETVRQTKNGSLIDISLTISPIRDARGQIIGASKIARDITQRKRADAQIMILAREAEHRAKNILANVQATVRLSHSDTVEGLKQSIEGRIQALANVHQLFAQSRGAGANLHALVREELYPYCQLDEKRVSIEGPQLLLKPDLAQAMGVTLHELTTNAAKYGALSVSEGHIQVTWSCGPDGLVVLRWMETGGPPVEPPKHHGFGTRAIKSVIQRQPMGEVNFTWAASRVICEIVVGQAI
jgi:PAS domain S-box-containing protein